MWLLAGVATLLAASGQIQFARWAGIIDVRAYAVPAVLELVAIAFLLIGYRRARRGDSPGAMWLLAAAVGGFAVYTNVAHSGRAGLVFGAASAITLILWFVKLRDDYRHFQRHTGQATRPRPKFGTLWFVARRLTTRAWVIAARRRISTVDESVAYAEVWRAVYEDSRKVKIRRALARRTAWRSVAEAAGGAWAELPRTAEVAAVDVVRRETQPADAPDPRPVPQIDRRDIPTISATPPMRQGTTLNGSSYPQLASALPLSLRDRVFAFLDEQIDPEEAHEIEQDDPYVIWMTSRALDADPDDVAQFVRQWIAGQPAAFTSRWRTEWSGGARVALGARCVPRARRRQRPTWPGRYSSTSTGRKVGSASSRPLCSAPAARRPPALASWRPRSSSMTCGRTTPHEDVRCWPASRPTIPNRTRSRTWFSTCNPLPDESRPGGWRASRSGPSFAI